jgi:thiamine monophosphate synthase
MAQVSALVCLGAIRRQNISDYGTTQVSGICYVSSIIEAPTWALNQLLGRRKERPFVVDEQAT